MAATDTVVISDYSDFLKEFYLAMIHKARAIKNIFLDEAMVKFDNEHVAGKYALVPVEFQSLTGLGSRAENGLMPIPDAGQYDTAKISLTYHFMVIQLSIQLMKESEGDRASFNPAFAQIMDTGITGWLRNLNRMVLGDGRGYLAQLDESSTDADVGAKDIDNAWGIANDGNGDLFISENMRFNLFNGDTMRTDGGVSDDGIINVESFTRGDGTTEATITTSSTNDWGTGADGDYLHMAGNKHPTNGTVYECNGVRNIIDDGTVAGTFQNINTTTRQDWKSFVHYGSSPGANEPLTRTRMNQPWKDIVNKGSGNPNLLFCGIDTEETYLELADSMNLTTNMKKLDVAGNWEGPTFRNSVMLSDPIYPENRIEFIDTSVLAMYQVADADWIPGDVGVLQKVANYANYQAEFAWFMQFGIRNRTKTGSLRDIETIV